MEQSIRRLSCRRPRDTSCRWRTIRRGYAHDTPYPNTTPLSKHDILTKLPADLEPYEAERHLLLGTQDSASTLSSLHYSWYTSDAPHTAPLYLARGTLPYLLTGNLRAANKHYLLFTSSLQKAPNPPTQPVSTKSSDFRVYPSLPLLNFLGLLLLSVERQLKSHYAADLKDVNWNEALDQIGEIYFGIKIPRQGNPMFDMLGSMFGGGMGGGGAPPKKAVGGRAPPAAGLD
jgi:hypothetical protein